MAWPQVDYTLTPGARARTLLRMPNPNLGPQFGPVEGHVPGRATRTHTRTGRERPPSTVERQRMGDVIKPILAANGSNWSHFAGYLYQMGHGGRTQAVRWAHDFATRDPEGFAAMVRGLPKGAT